MFKRRYKKDLKDRVRGWFWPKLGWRRWAQYIRHRVVRLPDTPHRIAAGLACGAAVSFTPFIGFHILLAVALGFLVRSNAVAAVIGTIVGNPWTFPFIWVFIYELGGMMMGLDLSVPFSELIDADKLLNNPLAALEPVFTPMIVGSVPVTIAVWFATYLPLRALIDQQQEERSVRIKKQKKIPEHKA
jgi:uncharacterized protein